LTTVNKLQKLNFSSSTAISAICQAAIWIEPAKIRMRIFSIAAVGRIAGAQLSGKEAVLQPAPLCQI
jgi:hypothetical protein